jgi:8-hydroxy-5-deazaflavin:NADPH oxidoreductase
MKTAIIGVGHIGATVAKNLINGGENVILANQTEQKAVQLAKELGPKAFALPIGEAIASADVIILCVWFDAIKDVLATYRSALAGKIVIDPSNPIAPDGNGGFKKIIPAEQSSGQLIAALLPGDAELVKAFGTLGADSLEKAPNRAPERAALFYATDFPEAAHVVARLITASGFSPVPVGGIDQSIRIEVGGDLHEFGALGKLVSASEAAALV